VNDNQHLLHDSIRDYFSNCTTKSWLKKNKHTFASSKSEGHGRIELRETWVSPIAGDWIDRSKWKDVHQVVCNRNTCAIEEKLQRHRRLVVRLFAQM
jgi:hypothetical protein